METEKIHYSCTICEELCSMKKGNSINDQFSLCNSCFIEYLKLYIRKQTCYPELWTPHDYQKQKEIVLEKWEELLTEFNKLLPLAKKRGGTLGHRIGSVRASMARKIDLIRDY